MDGKSDSLSREAAFAELGITVRPRTQQTIFGKTRSPSSFSKWEWIYLVVSLVSLLSCVGLTIERMVSLSKDTNDFTFAVLLFYTSVFCLYYVIHGVLRERSSELYVFVATIVIVMLYCLLNYTSNSDSSLNLIKLVRMVVALVVGVPLSVFGVWLGLTYYRSQDLIFRTVGGNENMQKMCHTLFVCSSLLKFDLQLEGSMLILALEHGTKLDFLEKLILAVGVPVAVLWITIGFATMRFENKYFGYLFLTTSVFEPAYVIYLFCDSASKSKFDSTLFQCIMAAGVCALIIRTSLCITMILVMKNFGQGLREKVYGVVSKSISSRTTEESVSSSAVHNSTSQ